eukprot:TRINITY_DN14371_c0_g1_i1.p1 TRINITY_DN14371_c0_g1~~TRINITY_DN14371_c0_g1_i1.p1  ORF type:complete len:386 (-),score=114.95 TRINITY_DN14371_c0_g1_i1:8-1165(-)
MSDLALLKWATSRTRGHDNVDPADNLKECWGNGLLWCALLYSYFPEKIPLPTMTCKTEADHIAACKLAFDVATNEAGCEPYLDPEDIVLVQDKKSILVYLSEIYNLTRDLPVKFQASSLWESNWQKRQKDEQMARIRARMEADRAGTPPPMNVSGGSGKKQSLAEKMAAKRAEEEAREKAEQEALRQKLAGAKVSESPAISRANEREERERQERESQERERAEAIKKQEAEKKARDEAERQRKKEEEEAKRAELLSATKPKPAPTVSSGNVSGALSYTISGAGAKGGPAKKLVIFTVTFTIDGEKIEGTKEDLIVYIDGPSTPVPRTNILGGTGGAYHVGFTPTEPGQHWIDFVYKGNACTEPFMLAVKNNFNKTPDFPYTGKRN